MCTPRSWCIINPHKTLPAKTTTEYLTCIVRVYYRFLCAVTFSNGPCYSAVSPITTFLHSAKRSNVLNWLYKRAPYFYLYFNKYFVKFDSLMSVFSNLIDPLASYCQCYSDKEHYTFITFRKCADNTLSLVSPCKNSSNRRTDFN